MDTYISVFKQTGCHDDAVNPFLPHHVPEGRNCLLLGSYNMGTMNMVSNTDFVRGLNVNCQFVFCVLRFHFHFYRFSEKHSFKDMLIHGR